MLNKRIIRLLDTLLQSRIGLFLLERESKKIRYLIFQLLILKPLLVDFFALFGNALVVEEMADPFILDYVGEILLFYLVGHALFV